ncbi:MAG: hypothetical protein M0R40_08740 [Firmicutes bacterium]|nr:hypothetical protein [Bacillota bacterium]
MITKIIKIIYRLATKSNENVEYSYAINLSLYREKFISNPVKLGFYLFKRNITFRILKKRKNNTISKELFDSGMWRVPAHVLINSLLKYNVVCLDLFDTMVHSIVSYDKYCELTTVSDSSKTDIDKMPCFYANPYISSIVDALNYNNVKIISIAPKTVERCQAFNLLSHAGYKVDDIVLSDNTNIFNTLWQKYCNNIKTQDNTFKYNDGIAYIGSDYKQIKKARNNGFAAYYYKKTREIGQIAGTALSKANQLDSTVAFACESLICNLAFSGLKKTKMANLLGYEAGVVCFSFCSFIERCAKKLQIDNVLFISDNEGMLPKIYSQVFGCKYETVCWSFVTAAKYCSKTKEEYVETLFNHKPLMDLNVGELLELLEIENTDLATYAIKLNSIVSENSNALSVFLMDNFSDVKRDKYDKEKQFLQYYLKQIIGENKRILLVDTAPNGNLAKSLIDCINILMPDTVTVYGLTLLRTQAEVQENILGLCTMTKPLFDLNNILNIFNSSLEITGFKPIPELFKMHYFNTKQNTHFWKCAFTFCRLYYGYWNENRSIFDISNQIVMPVLQHLSAKVRKI